LLNVALVKSFLLLISISFNNKSWYYFRREASLDVEVAASGFTKEMAEDFDDMVLIEDDEEGETDEEPDEPPPCDNEDLNSTTNESNVDCNTTITSQSAEADCELRKDFACAVAELSLDDVNGRLDSSKDECNESVSGFSCISRSTTATIAPEVIKQRLKKSFDKTDKLNAKKRIRAKGEASATTRQRRDNSDNIRQSTGIWGWE
jgi:hypothetical protein